MLSLRKFILARALTYIFLACLLLTTFTSCSPIAAPLPEKNSIQGFLQVSTSDILQRWMIYNETQVERSLLSKRGCFPSKEAAPSSPGSPTAAQGWICNAVIPGVDECATKLTAKGYVGAKSSVFYTGAPNGQASARRWATCNLAEGSWVYWSNMIDMEWYYDTTKAIEKPFGPDGLNLPYDEVQAKSDPFPKNLAQAFGEKSKGKVYLCIPQTVTPDDKSWSTDTAWGGWEYPALTRNADVTEIWRVDPTDDESEHGKLRKIWSKGDGPSATAPKGVRGPSLPADIPSEDIPPNWQTQPDS
ncbi:hypothetical protein MMC17_000480 [Xylographa soralifera]|nr:hypothetical protein [Xylographa soralifera]